MGVRLRNWILLTTGLFLQSQLYIFINETYITVLLTQAAESMAFIHKNNKTKTTRYVRMYNRCHAGSTIIIIS